MKSRSMKHKLRITQTGSGWMWWMTVGVGHVPLGLVRAVDTLAALARCADVLSGSQCYLCGDKRWIGTDHETSCLRCCR